ncbi:MAG: hypothetical protein KF850_34210 [Labilithrix sp.]|nr:hypothetical protein [Labilithrix sp.]
MKDFARRLAQLRGIACAGVLAVEYEDSPTDAIYSVGTSIAFADGTKLDAQFWRLIKAGRPLVSIFDHRQRYGLPAPVDAIAMLRDELLDKLIEDATMDEVTGDLHLRFHENVMFQVFNFMAFEIWEVTFPDGTGELSNYALTK